MAGAREERMSQPRAAMGERREGGGFPVCWDGDGGRPGRRMILWWWSWRRQANDDCGRWDIGRQEDRVGRVQ